MTPKKTLQVDEGSSLRSRPEHRKWLALSFCLLVMALAHAEHPNSSDLIGTWRVEREKPGIGRVVGQVTYQADGIFKGFLDVNGARMWRFSGKWVLSADSIHYKYTESDHPMVLPGFEDVDKVIKLTVSELVLKPRDGVQITYRRASPDKAMELPLTDAR